MYNNNKIENDEIYQNFRSRIFSSIIIPAYTRSGVGYKAHIEIEAIPSEELTVLAIGNVADAVKNIFIRAIEILGSLKPEWRELNKFAYKLTSTQNHFRVKDARSAGVPIAITLLNIFREINGKPQIDSILGTGILRIDGSFDASAYEFIKEGVIKRSYGQNKQFINAKVCGHILDLNNILNGNTKVA